MIRTGSSSVSTAAGAGGTPRTRKPADRLTMSRNRQRAKQRQGERRARQGPGQPHAVEQPVTDPRVSEPAPGIDPDLAVGAPPQEEGRSDLVVADEPLLDDDEHLTDEEELEELQEEEDEGYAPRGRRGADAPEKKSR